MLTHAFPIECTVAADEGSTELLLNQGNRRPASSSSSTRNGVCINDAST
jgi:hypothetical protein